MNQILDQLINLIKEEDLKTRKELWDNLFLIVDLSRLEAYYNMWNKEYKMLPLPNTYKELKTNFTEYCKKVNQEVDNLIESYRSYFSSEILPVLQKASGFWGYSISLK